MTQFKGRVVIFLFKKRKANCICWIWNCLLERITSRGTWISPLHSTLLYCWVSWRGSQVCWYWFLFFVLLAQPKKVWIFWGLELSSIKYNRFFIEAEANVFPYCKACSLYLLQSLSFMWFLMVHVLTAKIILRNQGVLILTP